MRILLRVALASASIASIGPAYAGEGEAAAVNPLSTSLPGVVAQPPARTTPAVAIGRNGQSIQVFGTEL